MAVTHRIDSIKEIREREELEVRMAGAPGEIELTNDAVLELADQQATLEDAVLELADLLG